MTEGDTTCRHSFTSLSLPPGSRIRFIPTNRCACTVDLYHLYLRSQPRYFQDKPEYSSYFCFSPFRDEQWTTLQSSEKNFAFLADDFSDVTDLARQTWPMERSICLDSQHPALCIGQVCFVQAVLDFSHFTYRNFSRINCFL